MRTSREHAVTMHRPSRLLLTARHVIIMGLALALLLPAAPALAGKLEDLRAAGIVGERFDGFVELREKGASDAKKFVNQLNAKRRKIYEKDAAKGGATVQDVGQIYAKKITGNAAKGTWFKNANGQWTQL